MKSTDLEDQQQQSLQNDTLSLYLDTAYLIYIYFYIIHETIRCNVWDICMYRSTQTQALSPCKKKIGFRVECCRFGSQKQQDTDLYLFAAS